MSSDQSDHVLKNWTVKVSIDQEIRFYVPMRMDAADTMTAATSTPAVIKSAQRPNQLRTKVLFPGASAVRGIWVTGTYRQGDDVPQPSPDIRLQ